MEFYLVQNQPDLFIGSLKTHSSVITALPSFKFNMVITGIKKVNLSPDHEL